MIHESKRFKWWSNNVKLNLQQNLHHTIVKPRLSSVAMKILQELCGGLCNGSTIGQKPISIIHNSWLDQVLCCHPKLGSYTMPCCLLFTPKVATKSWL